MKDILFAIVIMICIWSNAKADEGYLYLYIGAGHNSGSNSTSKWVGEDDLGGLLRFGYATRVSKKYNVWFSAGVTHVSQYDLGEPFNDKDESSLNHYGLGLEKRWRVGK